ncbi:tRNA uridine-5-carboxymethylaminomethyl(34) synthesis GTPase MnmE [bacterium]|nr:tRNA uridine-5-carboxymethylaminomethyl(34) synthesis GTPase MnmE [bacterium]
MPAYSTSDTITAPATVPGRSAIAMLRISGPEALPVLASLLGDQQLKLEHAHARLLQLNITGNGSSPLEEQAVVCCYHAPHSYTGDDLVEISIHGNPLLLELLLITVLGSGARLAEPGEFTYRAFANRKLDLMQAEAVHELINAGSSSALRLAASSLSGLQGKVVSTWRKQLLEWLAAIELIHDYASDDLDASIEPSQRIDSTELSEDLDRFREELSLALEASRRSALIRSGLSLAIVGAPNVGKSTLFNALLGYERALVHHAPGTTRDYLSESVEFGGISFVLVDTAGQHASPDAVESAGVDRARDWQDSADLLIIASAADGPAIDNGQADDNQRCIHVLTRCDLLPVWPQQEGQLAICALDGRGLAELREQIIQRSGLSDDGSAMSFNRRQAALVQHCLEHVDLALEAIRDGMPLDAAAQDLHLAREALSGLNDPGGRQSVVDSIFSSFCVGK